MRRIHPTQRLRPLSLPAPLSQSGCSLVLAAILLAGHGAHAQDAQPATASTSVAQGRLRGLSAVDENIAWASGVKGTVIRTVDGGASWHNVSVPGAGALDFRDIEAFSDSEAVVLAAAPGSDSKLYRTTDGGAHWSLVLQNLDPQGFYDCMAFEGDRGWMLGDPINGRYQVFQTRDRGAHWSLSNNGTPAVKDEAAFAASGTCIARNGDSTFVATGGAEANLHAKRDGSSHWQKFDSGMGRQLASAGVFSAAAMGDAMILVGGDYKEEKKPGNASVFKNGKMTVIAAPPGYRSGVACFAAGDMCVAVGPSGADVWNGSAWRVLDTASWDSVEISGNAVWMSGVKGRVGRYTRAQVDAAGAPAR